MDIGELLGRIAAASGRDPALDEAIATVLDPHRPAAAIPSYTGSVDQCLELLHRRLAGWHWHVGYGASGVLPYAAVARGEQRHQADGPTVPLALLAAIAKAAAASE